jgi:putative addiction module component (TIGR02574 family)
VESQALFTAALALPDADRALLAQRLLASLSPEQEDPDESDFLAELDRRFDECRSDPNASVPWSEMKRKR